MEIPVDSNAISFLKENMEMFGFGSEEKALKTSFIELLDNSVDAVINNHSIPASSKSINMKLSKQDSRESVYSLEVVDNGIGMEGNEIPLLCGGMFHTSKLSLSNHSQQTAGKFGVGLKAIMAYYNSTLTISSSTMSEPHITSYKVLSLKQ